MPTNFENDCSQYTELSAYISPHHQSSNYRSSVAYSKVTIVSYCLKDTGSLNIELISVRLRQIAFVLFMNFIQLLFEEKQKTKHFEHFLVQDVPPLKSKKEQNYKKSYTYGKELTLYGNFQLVAFTLRLLVVVFTLGS